jgi:hypothetical protein
VSSFPKMSMRIAGATPCGCPLCRICHFDRREKSERFLTAFGMTVPRGQGKHKGLPLHKIGFGQRDRNQANPLVEEETNDKRSENY